MAGWGKVAPQGRSSDTLQEVELTVQKDTVCEKLFNHYYNRTIQLCVGNPVEKKASFQVILRICLAWLWGKGCLGKSKPKEPDSVRLLHSLGCNLSLREESWGAASSGAK